MVNPTLKCHMALQRGENNAASKNATLERCVDPMEPKNPPSPVAATSVGIAAAVGFSPDIFIFVLIGHWIDNYGVAGYRYTFIFQICVAVLGICASLLGLYYKKKVAAQSEK